MALHNATGKMTVTLEANIAAGAMTLSESGTAIGNFPDGVEVGTGGGTAVVSVTVLIKAGNNVQLHSGSYQGAGGLGAAVNSVPFQKLGNWLSIDLACAYQATQDGMLTITGSSGGQPAQAKPKVRVNPIT